MKSLPIEEEQLIEFANNHKTPFYVYDEKGIINSSESLASVFKFASKYRNYFAIKALPNPRIMQILKNQGMGFDASSLGELFLCEKINSKDQEIIFTSNNTPIEEFKKCIDLNAVLNLDDIKHLDFIIDNGLKLPELISFRYNPGNIKQSEGNDIIGSPEEAKFGVANSQIFDAYKKAVNYGCTKFGLHTMLVSNETDARAIIETAEIMFNLAIELKSKLDIDLEFINLGGGFGIPYKPEDSDLNLEEVSQGIKEIYNSSFKNNKPAIYTECGRYVTGPHGYLVTKIRHIKNTYKNYAGVDATMADLMRPGMYGAYHHISVLGKKESDHKYTYDVVGSLCENNDKFAINRKLPELKPDDIIVIHDAGAHAHSMGFNYNAKLRPAEYIYKIDKKFEMIRRAETLDDYFATLDF